MLTGRPPFTGATIVEIYQRHLDHVFLPIAHLRADVPAPVARTIERMLAKDPADRIQTADELCAIVRSECLAQGSPASRGLPAAPAVPTAVPSVAAPPVAAASPEPRIRESLWEVQVRSGDGSSRESLFLSELKQKIRSGQVLADTPVRPAGSEAGYQPAATLPVLQREFTAR